MENFALEFNKVYEDFKKIKEKEKLEKTEKDQKIENIHGAIVQALVAITSFEDRSTTYDTNVQDMSDPFFKKNRDSWDISIRPNNGDRVTFTIEKKEIISDIEKHKDSSVEEIIQNIFLVKFKENIGRSSE